MPVTPLAPAPTTHAAARTMDPRAPQHPRLRIDWHPGSSPYQYLADDVRQGLSSTPKALPPKYFYDERGAQLFDAICDLPEYYLTRTEAALLAQTAADIVALSTPAEIVEFGSGTSRKTRLILDAATAARPRMRYLPFDVSGATLRESAVALLQRYPQLQVYGIVGDYEHDVHRIPAGRERLVLFLGSTIGNFSPEATAEFLATVRRRLNPGDHFLLGVDLLKPRAVLEAAYNDAAGLTAAFNRNMLSVVNRQLGADFRPEGFEHVAFFNAERSQIEMHLRAGAAHLVQVRRLGLAVRFAAGEMLHTEISRKFTRDEVVNALGAAGFTLSRWYPSPDNYFGLALAQAQ